MGDPDAPSRHAHDCTPVRAAGDERTGRAAAQNDYPARDSGYHSYAEMVEMLQDAEAAYPDIVRVFSIGESLPGPQASGPSR